MMVLGLTGILFLPVFATQPQPILMAVFTGLFLG